VNETNLQFDNNTEAKCMSSHSHPPNFFLSAKKEEKFCVQASQFTILLSSHPSTVTHTHTKRVITDANFN